jgi:hypothetical protein
MEICDVCQKELGEGYSTLDIYQAHLIKRGVKKGKVGTSVSSEYGKFEPVSVKVCKRHLRGLWSQRLFPGFIALILLYIPITTLISLIPIWSASRPLLFATGVIVTLIPVYFLVRRISYDGYIAALLTQYPKNREAKIEYFGQARYRRMMRNLARLDSVLNDSERK